MNEIEDDYECRYYDLFTGDGKIDSSIKEEVFASIDRYCELTFTEQQVKAASKGQR